MRDGADSTYEKIITQDHNSVNKSRKNKLEKGNSTEQTFSRTNQYLTPIDAADSIKSTVKRIFDLSSVESYSVPQIGRFICPD